MHTFAREIFLAISYGIAFLFTLLLHSIYSIPSNKLHTQVFFCKKNMCKCMPNLASQNAKLVDHKENVCVKFSWIATNCGIDIHQCINKTSVNDKIDRQYRLNCVNNWHRLKAKTIKHADASGCVIRNCSCNGKSIEIENF